MKLYQVEQIPYNLKKNYNYTKIQHYWEYSNLFMGYQNLLLEMICIANYWGTNYLYRLWNRIYNLYAFDISH